MTASDATDQHQPAEEPTERIGASNEPVAVSSPPLLQERDVLKARIDIGAKGWFGLLSVIGLLVALGMRFTQLGIYTLTQGEAEWAYNSWTLYLGKQLPNGVDLPTVSPLFMLLQSLSFFLFGVTDAVARIMPAIFGLGLVALILLLRPFVSRFAIVGMLLIAAISPTLVFASRSSDPIVLVGFFSLLFFISVLRAGVADARNTTAWAGLAGFSIAATLASGPEGITALIAIGVGLAIGVFADPGAKDQPRGAVASSLRALLANSRAMASALAALVISLVILFTRGFSDIGALSGLAKTFSDWGETLATQSSTTPVQFFFYSSLLYEIVAVVFAIVAVSAGRSKMIASDSRHELHPAALASWFVVALLLQSLASGKQPDQLTVVTLPLILLGGLGLGYVLERMPWNRMLTTSAGLVPLALAGILIGVIAALVLVARANDPAQSGKGFLDIAMPIVFVLVVVVAPLVFLVAGESGTRSQISHLGWSAMLVVAVLLGLYTIGSSTSLSFHRADTGLEPAAQGTSTTGLRAFVDQTKRLSRDLTVGDVSNIDNTGSFGLKIAISPEVEWPYVWYFRDFYQMRVTSPAGWNDADLVIGSTPDGMEDAGYVVQTRSAFNRVPTSFEDMNSGTILSHIFKPGEWYSGIRFLLFRDLASDPTPSQTSVGYTFRLSNQINPNLGPFDLTDDVGPGSGLGQLNRPAGIAVSPDGQTIYVVDSGNQRVERYAIDGTFIGVWDVNSDPALDFATQFGQGPQGLATDDNGLVYVADTWNHRIVVLDAQGQIVRELGQKGVVTDTADSPDPNVDTGRFYGPRGVAVADGEIYVTDTGNERVQVFAQDGTFLRTFGGHGTEPGKLIEPTGIALGPDGNVYVADSGNGRISVFAKDGTFVRVIAVPQWQAQVVQQNYLAFGPDGLLYATASSQAVIVVIDPGTGNQVYSGNGDSGQALQQPLGISVASDGTVYITDTGTSRVIWFKLDLPPATSGTPVATPVSGPQAPGDSTPVG